MCRDYYTLQFMDPSVDTRPIAPALAAFFDNVLDKSISELNFKVNLSEELCTQGSEIKAKGQSLQSVPIYC